MPLLSIIIPIYNEAENLLELYSRLKKTLTEDFQDFSHEIIFIDDGSTDQTLQILKDFHKKDTTIKVVSFSRNFGHHMALTAGIEAAKGDYAVMMDGDLQDRPEEIPTIFNKLQDGYDCVITIRKNRQDPFFKKILSAFFYRITDSLLDTKIPRNQAMLRIFNKKVLTELKRFREKHFMLAGIMTWVGFKQATLEIRHDPRKHGHTKYTFSKSLVLATNAIVSFSHKPLTWISTLGILFAFLSILYGLFIIYEKLIHGYGIMGWPSLIAIVTFLGGLTLFSIGLVGLYIGRIYEQSLNRPLYIVKELLE